MLFLLAPTRTPTFAGDVNYERPKSTTTNTTPINVDFTAGEEPTALAALTADNSGSTGILNVTVTADADPTGGADIQDLFRIEDLQVVIDPTTFRCRLQATVIAVKGDGTDGTSHTIDIAHDEDMDAWQTAAGQARAA